MINFYKLTLTLSESKYKEKFENLEQNHSLNTLAQICTITYIFAEVPVNILLTVGFRSRFVLYNGSIFEGVLSPLSKHYYEIHSNNG